MKRWVGIGLLLLAFTLLIVSCSEKSGGLRLTNVPPETFITYGPSWRDTTEYKVHLYWYGKDVDGEVAYYEVVTVTDLDSLEPCWTGENLPWGRTTSGESTFVVRAGSKIVADTASSRLYPPIKQVAPWAILIRAVDNDGEPDPCPASAFFIAGTAIPKVTIKVPSRYGPNASSNPVEPVAYFQWEGKDPDGVEEYLKYKYLVIERDSVVTNGQLDLSKIPPFSKESETQRIGWWSKWVPSDSNKVVGYDLSRYKDLQPREKRQFYLFVTAMDEAGGYIPISIFKNYNGGGCLAFLEVSPYGGGCPPVVDAGFVGKYGGGYSSPPSAIYLFQGSKVKFIFWASENRKQGRLVDVYRYYFDYEDNTNPPSRWIWTKVTQRNVGADREWFVKVPEKDGKHVDWVFDTPGPHRFVVETRDYAGTVKQLVLQFQILEGPDPTKRGIFFVDDAYLYPTEQSPAGNYDASLKAFWQQTLDGYPHEPFFDTGDKHKNDIRNLIEVLGKATTVIWNVDVDDLSKPFSGSTQLLRACTEYGAFLHSYVKLGGNLIIIGHDPLYACCYWPDLTIIEPGKRSSLAGALDFKPRISPSTGDSLYNFLWDVFGIRQMSLLQARELKFIPCIESAPDWQDTIDIDMSKVGTQYLACPYHIADYRMPDDREYPFRTTPELMFSTVGKTDKGEIVNNCGKFVGIYVPAAQGYGHAAYIAMDPYWVADQEKMKQVIWKLLEKFGERRNY